MDKWVERYWDWLDGRILESERLREIERQRQQKREEEDAEKHEA